MLAAATDRICSRRSTITDSSSSARVDNSAMRAHRVRAAMSCDNHRYRLVAATIRRNSNEATATAMTIATALHGLGDRPSWMTTAKTMDTIWAATTTATTRRLDRVTTVCTVTTTAISNSTPLRPRQRVPAMTRSHAATARRARSHSVAAMVMPAKVAWATS